MAFKTLDKENIPNLANLDEAFLDQPFGSGNVYTLPYQSGTIGIGYNRANMGGEFSGWADLFAYEGPVAWLEDVRGALGVALLMLGFDPNTRNPDEIAQVRDYLVETGR